MSIPRCTPPVADRSSPALPLALAACALLVACGQGATAPLGEQTPAAVVVDDAGWELYGAPVTDDEPLALAAVLDDAASYDGATVLLEAPVVEVCQTKGCWLVLADGDREVRVTFKDYAFFMPMDCDGRTVVVEGVFAVKQIPVDEARHYLEDAGRADEAAAITAPTQGYVLEATGVRLAPAA